MKWNIFLEAETFGTLLSIFTWAFSYYVSRTSTDVSRHVSHVLWSRRLAVGLTDKLTVTTQRCHRTRLITTNDIPQYPQCRWAAKEGTKGVAHHSPLSCPYSHPGWVHSLSSRARLKTGNLWMLLQPYSYLIVPSASIRRPGLNSTVYFNCIRSEIICSGRLCHLWFGVAF